MQILILNEFSQIDKSFLEKVLTKVILDSDGNPFENWIYKDLAKGDKYTEAQWLKEVDLEALRDLIQTKRPDKIIAIGTKVLKLLTGEKLKLKKAFKLLPEFEHKCEVYGNYATVTEANQQDFLEVFDRVFNDIKIKTTPYKIVTEIEDIKQVFDWCRQEGICCFDFETTGLDYWSENFKATVLSISFQAGFSYIIPIDHFEYESDPRRMELFREIIEDKSVIKVGHNLKYDLHVCKVYGINKFKGRFSDTMLAHHLLDENSPQDLKSIGAKYFPHTEGYELNPPDWAKVPMDELAPYAATDTDLTLKLFVLFEELLIEDDSKHRLYIELRNLSMPLMFALLEAEHVGMQISPAYIEESIKFARGVSDRLSKQMMSYKEVLRFEEHRREDFKQKAIEEIEAKMLTAKGKNLEKYQAKLIAIRTGELQPYEGINLNSHTQLGDLLFDKEGFGLPLFKDKKKGLIKTTDAKNLATYKDVPFIDLLALHRSVEKAISTYYEGILECRDSKNIVHTSLLQHSVVTGRLSCRTPSLHTIPSREKKGDEEVAEVFKRIKKFFTVPEGFTLIQADFKQAELRIAASISGDENMIQAYLDGIDLHKVTGARVANMPLEDFVKSDQMKHFRTIAKSVNFGFLYGSSIEGYIDYVFGQTRQVIDKKTAKAHQDAMFDAYPKLTEWHRIYKAKAHKYKYVRTIYGRKRRLPNIDSHIPSFVGDAERQSVNSVIQGSSGEWTNFIMALLYRILPSDCKVVLSIHDALYFLIPTEKVDAVIPIITELGAEPPNLEYFDITNIRVPMELEVALSEKSWGDMEDYVK